LTCYHPLDCVGVVSGRTGRLAIRFSGPGEPMQVPCGQCIGCRLDRSVQWAARCMHEAQLHDENCFITLTYDDDHIPKDRSLCVKHFQDFMKRLRKRVGKVRFFHCGEYGDIDFRPHYHACLFGFQFTDLESVSTRDGSKKFSPLLMDLWPYGFNVVGDVTFESAAYVARYCMKKVTGSMAKDHYGEKKPEYVTMSRRPGIGSEWIKKFKSETYRDDTIIVRGVPTKPPRFYDEYLDVDFGKRVDVKFRHGLG